MGVSAEAKPPTTLIDKSTSVSADGRSVAQTVRTVSVASVEELLEEGLHLAGASPVHLTIRGTAGADDGALRLAGDRADGNAAGARHPVLAAAGSGRRDSACGISQGHVLGHSG